MKVVSKKSFNKDIDNISVKSIARKLRKIIQTLEEANALSELKHVKKMKGANDAYRIKLGNYRIGFFYYSNEIQLTIFAHRKDIYKYFP